VKYELIIVRYGEIALKGKETRNRFESTLVNNINNALRQEKLNHSVKRERGRIFVFTDEIQKSTNVLQKVFGITSVSPAYTVDSGMDSMSDFAVKISKENNLTEKISFALRVTRTGNHSYSSQDVAIRLGNDIVKATRAKVNLSKPSFKLSIEIRGNEAYFFVDKLRGTGGMPINTQGKVLSLIDSIESILAAWYLMRRGCNVVFLSSDKSLQPVIDDFLKKWYASSKILTFNSNGELFQNVNKIGFENNCEAIVTSYTLDDMTMIERSKKECDLPILHPLISMEKDEIRNKSKEIGL